jgi:outer membrane protein insertion porin family
MKARDREYASRPNGARRWIGYGGACALGVWIATAAYGQTFRFNAFEVEGNQRIEDATVIATLGVTPGETMSAAQLNEGIQRLQASGLFQSVEVVPQGGRLLVLVEEFPTVSRIAIEGNARIPDEALLTVVGSEVRRVYSPRQAERDAEAIADAYFQAGRLAATVTPKIIRRADNRVDLVFEVAEGRVVEVERVGFVGNRAYSDRRLRRVLETKQAGIFRTLISADTFFAERVSFDRRLLEDFYRSRGYVDATVLSATPELSAARDAYFLTFQIREGQQYRFGRAYATSTLPDVDGGRYDDEVRIGAGDIYTPQAVDRTVERLELLALREGLSFVRVVPRVVRNDRDLTLDVEFVIERGPRVFVERIDIEGNATTLDQVIRRQFATVEGDPFNPREIRAAADRIRALGYFSQSDVTAREGTTPETVIIDVDVEEQPTGSLGFGVSYSVDSGASVAVSFAEENFLGRGQQLAFRVDTGTEQSNTRLAFREPAFLDRDLAFDVSVFASEGSRTGENFETSTIGFETGLTFPVGEYSRLRLDYTLARTDLERRDEDDVVSAILARDADDASLTSAVGYDLIYSTIGRGLDPTRGIRLSFGQEFAGLGGDEKFVKTIASAVAERTVRNDEVVLRAGLTLGALTSLDDTVSVRGNRFFNSPNLIRGFESGGIGPRDQIADNDPLGGNYFASARFEAQFPLGFIPDEYGMTGAAFLDAGSVWGLDDVDGGLDGDDGLELVDDDFFLNSAVGVSLLWDTQIGPLRFNFSTALDNREFDEEQNFDLTIQTRF